MCFIVWLAHKLDKIVFSFSNHLPTCLNCQVCETFNLRCLSLWFGPPAWLPLLFLCLCEGSTTGCAPSSKTLAMTACCLPTNSRSIPTARGRRVKARKSGRAGERSTPVAHTLCEILDPCALLWRLLQRTDLAIKNIESTAPHFLSKQNFSNSNRSTKTAKVLLAAIVSSVVLIQP